MTTAITITLVLLSLLAVLSLLYAARGRAAAIEDLEQLEGRTQAVDLEAFQRLLDSEEEKFLRENLEPAEFRAIRRERLKVALEYVGRTAHNASILARLGQHASHSSDPEQARAGRELAQQAVYLRFQALLAAGKLYLALLLPAGVTPPESFAGEYQRLRERLGLLSRLQKPSSATRISAAI